MHGLNVHQQAKVREIEAIERSQSGTGWLCQKRLQSFLAKRERTHPAWHVGNCAMHTTYNWSSPKAGLLHSAVFAPSPSYGLGPLVVSRDQIYDRIRGQSLKTQQMCPIQIIHLSYHELWWSHERIRNGR